MEKSSLVSPGDRIAIHWPMDDGSTKPFDGEVTHCKASHRKRHGERFRYTIRFADGDVRKSRLRHLAWCRLDSAQDEQTGPQEKRKRQARGQNEDDEDLIEDSPVVKEDRDTQKKRKKNEKGKHIRVEEPPSPTAGADAAAVSAEATKAQYPPVPPQPTDTTILLFYAYCRPPMTSSRQDTMIADCHGCLSRLGITGRLRVAREGFNATLTGPTPSIREFTAFLCKTDPKTFGSTDFKYVDGQTRNKRLKELKVWAVTEIVTYGFDPADAPLDMRGTHLTPREFHKAMEDKNSIMIDVRNFNESLIGRFDPPGGPVLDPHMRRSTEFPEWVENHKKDLEGKKVLMYCTGGVRCERASAFMRLKGVQNVFQLEGGIHRYLDEFPQDGGYWKGKNYTFDRRFSHGAEVSEVISKCVVCGDPWDRYQAQLACKTCHMEVLVCKLCQRKPEINKKTALSCPLCK